MISYDESATGDIIPTADRFNVSHAIAPVMAINFEDYPCEFCGKPSTNVVFAAFVCDDPECIEKARIARGGPGGHMKRKAEGLPILPDDLQ